MRILHVTTFLQGGAGRVIADLAIHQRRAGHDVIVVSDSGEWPGYGSYPEYLQALDAAGIDAPQIRSTFTREIAVNVDAAGSLNRIIGDRDIDLIHAHAAIPSMVARLASRTRSVPIVITVHGWGTVKTADHVRTDVTLLGLADAVVTPSAALRARLRQLGVSQHALHLIPYGIGHGPTAPVDASEIVLIEAIRARGASIAMCIGTVGERKNQRLLVEALAHDDLRDVHAVFIGDGDASMLASEAARRGVTSRTHILGYRSEASRYLPHADVLVLPSKDEGLPLVVLEAFRDGVPVVASETPELIEALDGGRLGYLAAGGTAAGLAQAISCARSIQGRERPGCAARARLRWEERHRLPHMIAGYARVYAHAMDAAGAETRRLA